MKEEVKNLLHRLLWSIVKNGEAGILNAFQDLNVDNAEFEFDYAVLALEQLKNLEKGEEIDWKAVAEALDNSTAGDDCMKVKIEAMLGYGYYQALSDCEATYEGEELKAKAKELESMYYPSDRLISELQAYLPMANKAI